MITKENYYILTGGPGSGKTSLINELSERGFMCVPEVARQIIQKQVQINGVFLPWKDARGYSRLMLEASISDFITNNEVTEKLFFDRGVPDTLGYEILMKFPKCHFLENMSFKLRYNKKIFLLPPWMEIYENDNERKQDFAEAVKTYEVMKSTYKNLNYTIIEVPCVSVKDRVDFILKNIE